MFLAYVTARLVDDPHLWVRTLFDELEDLGYTIGPTIGDLPRRRAKRCTARSES